MCRARTLRSATLPSGCSAQGTRGTRCGWGQVIGLLTRPGGVDRALFPDGRVPLLRQVMKVGAITVNPQDSIERLRNTMLQSGWGQIPVVENGQVTGVVTRTDLISLWGTPPQSPI